MVTGQNTVQLARIAALHSCNARVVHSVYMHFKCIWRAHTCNTKSHATACNNYTQLCVILHEILQLEIISACNEDKTFTLHMYQYHSWTLWRLHLYCNFNFQFSFIVALNSLEFDFLLPVLNVPVFILQT